MGKCGFDLLSFRKLQRSDSRSGNCAVTRVCTKQNWLHIFELGWVRSGSFLTARLPLCSFIYERVRRHGDSNTVLTRAQLGGRELCDPGHKKLGQCLQQIGDELDGNVELQRWPTCPCVDSFTVLKNYKEQQHKWLVLIAKCFPQDDRRPFTPSHQRHVYESCHWDLLRWEVQLGQGGCVVLLCLSTRHQSGLINFVALQFLPKTTGDIYF